MNVKEIGYVYPSSTNAEKFKRRTKGGWTVSIGQQFKTIPIACFDTWEEAHAFAEQRPEPYSRYSSPKPEH